MEKIIFTAEENSFIVEADGKKLKVSYDEFYGNHEDAMKFCKEHNGGDESVDNLRFLARHKAAINEELREQGKEIIGNWLWSNEVAWWNDAFAFVVDTLNGSVDNGNRHYNDYARAVSAL